MSALAAALTLGAAVRVAAATLRSAGVATPDLDARILAAHVLGYDAAQLIAGGRTPVDPALVAQLNALIDRRAGGEPVARILGRREFWGRDFLLNAATLVPRPDSETLVEAVLASVDAGPGRAAPLRIADLGTGSGCLLIALLTELPAAIGVGTDISIQALAAARDNARINGVEARAAFVLGSWGESLAPVWDVIVANPPYIASGAIAALAPDVARYDPLLALDGGVDGLDAYRELLPSAQRVLAPSGRVFMEFGQGQEQALVDLTESAGLVWQSTRRDLTDSARVVVVGSQLWCRPL